ncbi:uracil phosphoribosyltransferase [bacterium]|jgi:uracil phosphoribosyltransferase|nr:uracil phosphoribosyltransferase [bacterium]MEC7841208.1 uracil phosphoribosyltransferase [Actinomycetota bacterium]MEC8329454.1 uracil phosphoribosyltransferase [Actinomycetota bacterium]MED5382853.1 uracil phosphoribosyltransferase [Actinomycetota bacterium]GIS38240.1 MAG: uracil phosphoribosyltransferase [Actinomycetota bacterium]|tara:strand:+ start:367 stop:987 length:621 start_codon:yes stop_codon:yes gene_type:complete
MELIEISHPLKDHYLTNLRDKNTDFDTFRDSASKLSYFLVVEATKHLTTLSKEIDTPLTKTKGVQIENNSVAISVLRAGLGLMDGVQQLIPNISFGYIGVQRNEETAQPENYYEKLPDLVDKNVFILEPMLATGGSLSFAIETVKKYNPKNIHALTVISAPEGINKIKENHPDITLVTASIDEKLDDNWYIVPGLGDMGDRLFGTT